MVRSERINKLKEYGFKALLIVCAGLSIAAILVIVLYLLVSGIPAIAEIGLFKFLFGTNWQPTNEALPVSERFGILPMIVGSIYITAAALIIAVPLGVLSSVFLVYFCPKRLRGVMSGTINLLAGIPSVVYGLFGLTVLVPILKEIAYGMGIAGASGDGVMAGGIVLAIMVLPTIISISRNALLAVPKNYFEGATALGATKEQAVFKVMLPAAKRGVAASVIMAAGRVLGETMAVAMVSGSAAVFPESPFHSMRTLTTNIVKEMGYAGEFHTQALIATGIVLLVFVLILNFLLRLALSEKTKNTDKMKKTKITEITRIKEIQGGKK